MGPLATVDFMEKVIGQTRANCDQDHLPMIIHCVPQIPDRTACLMNDAASPLPAMKQGVKVLASAGVGCIAITCNTAHYWYDDLIKDCSIPILHIARACADVLVADGITSVGLMGTDGTLKAGFYPRELTRYGIELKQPGEELQKQVMAGIYKVKSGEVSQGGALLEQCLEQMLLQGVDRVILGCTEIPLALEHINSTFLHKGVDATKALAMACINWHVQCDMEQVA